MRKFVILLLIIGVAIVIASLYGVGHDQVAYSVSPEYYTKFKFIQLNLADSGAAQHMTQPRSAVVMVGVKSTWWMGLCMGILFGLFALVLPDAETMFQSALQAMGISILIILLTAIAGGLYGHNVLAATGDNSWLPPNVVDKSAFITVRSIQTYSFLGWIIGLAAGMLFLLVKNARLRRRSPSR